MSGKNVKKKDTAGTSAPSSSSTEPFEIEQQFILRLPIDAAACLHEDLKEASNVQIKDKLFIEMDPDMRHGRVRYGGDIFFAKLLDMPSIIESLKTVDKKTFYKTADICQMLLCKRNEELIHEDTEALKKKDKDKRYTWNHGITPSLKNVRKRRFRKTLKKKYMDQPEVEKEVRRLFRYDAEAIDVKYEIILDDEKSASEAGQSQGLDSSVSVSDSGGHLVGSKQAGASLDIASFFGEVSSSEEEEEDEKDINIMDSGEDEASRGATTPKGNNSMSSDRGESQEATMTDSETAEFQEKLKELVKQLEEIRERRSHQEDQLATQEDDALKGEMQGALNKLVQEENEKERELEILSVMLNQ